MKTIQRNIPLRRAWSIEAGVVLSVFGIMAMTGPFGTFSDLTLPERLLYWGFMIIVNWLQLRIAQLGLSARFGRDRFWLVTLGPCVLASVPATFEVLWLEGLFRPEIAGKIGFLSLYPQVLILSAAIMVPLSWFFLRRPEDTQTPQAPEATTADQTVSAGPAAFFRRVPVALGRDLYALQAEDHYIRVHTALGSDLILLRMSDAIAELDGAEGLQVHRSWWVARSGLAETARRDRRTVLVLKNGVEVPVSRTYMAAVREAGWLA